MSGFANTAAVLATAIAITHGASAQSQDATTPVSLLDRGLTELMATAPTVPFERRYAKLAPIIDQSFDCDAILQAIVGTNWTTLPTVQQQTLLASFQRFTVSNYVANFSSNRDTTIKLQPGSQVVGAARLVSTSIMSASGEPTKINYIVKQGNHGWRITDVYLDGTISQVAVQRSDFRSLLASSNAEQLIHRLDSKAVELSGGAIRP